MYALVTILVCTCHDRKRENCLKSIKSKKKSQKVHEEEVKNENSLIGIAVLG